LNTGEDMIGLVRNVYDAINRQDLGTLADLFTEDCVRHYVRGNAPIAGDHVGREAVLTSYRYVFELTAGVHHCEVGNVLANDVLVASYHQESATRARDGAHLDTPMFVRWKVSDGQVSVIRDYANDVPGLIDFLT
jgi:ketosteroid isomerase-like protein